MGPDSDPFGFCELNCLHKSANELYKFGACMCSLLEIGSEFCKCDLPFGLDVDVGTGVVVAKPTGVYGTVMCSSTSLTIRETETLTSNDLYI